MLKETYIVVTKPSKGVTITQPCVQALIEPYLVVALVQLIRSRSDQTRRQPKVESFVAQRKSKRLVKVKHELAQQPSKGSNRSPTNLERK